MDKQDINSVPQGGLTKLLGIEFPEATADRVVATMPVTPNHHQPFGYLHGARQWYSPKLLRALVASLIAHGDARPLVSRFMPTTSAPYDLAFSLPLESRCTVD